MSKKTNTLLFILGATVFNILVTVASFILLLVLFAKFLMPLLPETGAAWAFPVIFIASIALSFLVYRLVLKALLKKIDMEKHFDPIFGRRRPPARNSDG
jgi:membrane protein implicated in regulation of membrane protease activity